MSKILVVEDDPDTLSALCDILRSEHHVVDPVANLADAKGLVSGFGHDLIILDWELPDGTGLDMLKFCRETGTMVPILMLTAKSDIASKEAGFDAGADDYLTKPFQPRELAVRVRALLRRATQKPTGELDVLNMQNIRWKTRSAIAQGVSPPEFSNAPPGSCLPPGCTIGSNLAV
jgi:two-component system, OmpR family, response regulator